MQSCVKTYWLNNPVWACQGVAPNRGQNTHAAAAQSSAGFHRLGGVKLGKSVADILTRIWEGMAPWVIKKTQRTNKNSWNMAQMAGRQRHKGRERFVSSELPGEDSVNPACTCVCTSASLNRMNQWLENRPAFCRVSDLLLLSHTTRRCGRRRASWWTNTRTHFINNSRQSSENDMFSTWRPAYSVLQNTVTARTPWNTLRSAEGRTVQHLTTHPRFST